MRKTKEKEIEFDKLKSPKIRNFLHLNSISQSEHRSNKDKENSDVSSNNRKKTIRDSELDHDELIINDSPKDSNNIDFNIINKNNFFNDDNQINDYKKIYNEEVTNKIKYELEQDLIKKQKENVDKRIKSAKHRKLEKYKLDIIKGTSNKKLTLLDLESQKNQKMKEIENLLKGGVTDNKLKHLEENYKNNRDVMEIIYKYKTKKYNIENSNSLNNYISESKNMNPIQVVNLNKYQNKLKKQNKMKDYSDLSPFYYISNGNKVSNDMWGYNDKGKYSTSKSGLNINLNNKDDNILSSQEIIQNKLNIFKKKIFTPFWEKVEKEKKNEIKREQILKKIEDPKIKENLESKYAIERGKIDFELTKEKERINKAIRDYEDSLFIGESLNKPQSKTNIFFE